VAQRLLHQLEHAVVGFQLGPNLKASAWFAPAQRRSARHRQPLSGSSTCCQGRVAAGLRTPIGSPRPRARIASGTIRSAAQSPQPITFRARATRRWGVWCGWLPQKLARQLAIASSAAALLLL
jgi:hypothetical protein